MTLHDFDQQMRAFLCREELLPHLAQDNLYNGLMTHGSGQVTKVGFGVSASVELFRLAKAAGCDAIIVHHGLNIPAKQLDLSVYKRLEFLIKNDIALWSAHFVLDAHPEVGNNAQILQAIGTPNSSEPYVDPAHQAPWGRLAHFMEPLTVTDVLEKLDGRLSPQTIVYDFGPTENRTVAAVSGGGAPRSEDFAQLKELGVDLFITGEVGEWNREQIRELEINLIAGGHYHTERFGVQALQPVVESWGLETVWLELENPV